MKSNRNYREADELRRYVWNNYSHALAKREHALHHAATLELKARHRQSEFFSDYRQMKGYFFDPEVAAIAGQGLGVYEQQCCERLLREYASQIYINRCGLCGRIVASPIACACIWCGHHWYERREELVSRAKSSIYPGPQNKPL